MAPVLQPVCGSRDFPLPCSQKAKALLSWGNLFLWPKSFWDLPPRNAQGQSRNKRQALMSVLAPHWGAGQEELKMGLMRKPPQQVKEMEVCSCSFLGLGSWSSPQTFPCWSPFLPGRFRAQQQGGSLPFKLFSALTAQPGPRAPPSPEEHFEAARKRKPAALHPFLWVWLCSFLEGS